MRKEVTFMRRRICALIILVVLALSISVQAIEPRTSAQLSLSFDGTTALCSVICRGSSSDDAIDATLTLYQGSTYVDSWSDSGKGRVVISGTCKAVSGKNYKLVVDYSVNGESQPSVYSTRQCPWNSSGQFPGKSGEYPISHSGQLADMQWLVWTMTWLRTGNLSIDSEIRILGAFFPEDSGAFENWKSVRPTLIFPTQQKKTCAFLSELIEYAS